MSGAIRPLAGRAAKGYTMLKYFALPLVLIGLLAADVSTTRGKDDQPTPTPAKVAAPPQMTLSNKIDGPAMKAFGASEATIVATFTGEGLAKGDKVRVVWTLEDGGKTVTPNVKLYEYSVEAKGPRSKGSSQLTKPATGWPLGKYRADFYVNAAKIQSVKFTIK